MKIEHVAFQVADPAAVADWYVAHLGFVIKRQQADSPFMTFIADSAGSVMIELYNNPSIPVPDYASMPALALHLAFMVDDTAATRQRLLDAGATIDADTNITPAGDELTMLRDPWGFCIQLVKRQQPML